MSWLQVLGIGFVAFGAGWLTRWRYFEHFAWFDAYVFGRDEERRDLIAQGMLRVEMADRPAGGWRPDLNERSPRA